jgi:quercetin dioxygenase-like cupin family protein
MAHIIPLSELSLGRRAVQFEGAKYDSTISFFITRHEQGAGASPHRHPYAETFIVQDGAAAFTVDGELLEVGAGNVVVVPAGAVHSFKGAGSDTLGMVAIHAAPEMVTEWIEED